MSAFGRASTWTRPDFQMDPVGVLPDEQSRLPLQGRDDFRHNRVTRRLPVWACCLGEGEVAGSAERQTEGLVAAHPSPPLGGRVSISLATSVPNRHSLRRIPANHSARGRVVLWDRVAVAYGLSSAGIGSFSSIFRILFGACFRKRRLMSGVNSRKR
jgi:hypothetical protein